MLYVIFYFYIRYWALDIGHLVDPLPAIRYPLNAKGKQYNALLCKFQRNSYASRSALW